MRFVLAFAALFFVLNTQSQTEYEILLYEASVADFDVFGDDTYETNNRTNKDITTKIKPEIGATNKAEPQGNANFEAKNLLDGNMKTCWMTPGPGKNEAFEIVIDVEELEGVNSVQITDIFFFNGWRKDLHTWKEYNRIKKLTITISEQPFAEVTFEDTYHCQSIDIEKLKIDKSRRCRMKFRISEVYPGTKYNQVALSDVQFGGRVK
jgi:hypothetical protein